MKKIYFVFILSLFVFVFDAAAQKSRLIGEVQGDKFVSPYFNETAKLSGIVTARVRNGFFLQSPDDKTDGNPNTSEGIFVFTGSEPSGEAALGNLVSVTGTIDEFRPKPDPQSLPITQLRMKKGTDLIAVESKGNPLPKPVLLTVEDFKSNKIDQLEKYEGMRVTVAELTVVAPTGGRGEETKGTAESNGTFYAVVKGVPRPFREAGFDVYDFLTMPEKDREKFKKDLPKMTLFDHNPERLRIESTAQLGAQAIDVTSYAEIKNLTGVVYYSYRAYSIMVDADNKPLISNLVKAKPLPVPTDRQFSIAASNLERLFDDEDDPNTKEPIINAEGFDKRLKKISLAVRGYMQTPDVVGIVEAENLAVLKKLADRINKDAEAAGKPNPNYEAYLVEGNDFGGIDSGFLVKRARVEVLETKQFGKDEKFQNPVSKEDVFLNDRPPFMLRAAIKDAKTNQPFEFTVIVNHMKSFNDYNDEKKSPFVRMKKKLQAEFLTKYVAERLKANPQERIALVGDFNFYQFNDGIMDVMGTIRGVSAAKDSIMTVSEDLLNPDLTNLVEKIKPAEMYSYSFDGNAQVLDHFLVNDAFLKHVVGFGYARVNADFPESYRNDTTRVERFSDHDAAVAFFTLDSK